jgi:DNA processing protein
MGPITASKLMRALKGDPLTILNATKEALQSVEGVGPVLAETINAWKTFVNLDKERALLRQAGVRFTGRGDADYPQLLQEIYDPPLGFYSKGKASLEKRSIAIIGSRRATLYGVSMAKRLARELASLGFAIVSGLARGIDTAAHEGALDANGVTVAVLGCGVDIVYPPENQALYERVVDSGRIISEFKLGRRADRQTFPMRNRIISGMSEATIVVESDVKGGSMITARMAGEQGRLVFAVPGRVDQASSRGCHQLIRDGAILLRSVDDLLEELQYGAQLNLGFTEKKSESSRAMDLSEDETRVLGALSLEGTLSMDTLASMTELPTSTIAGTLLLLELKKLLVKRADGLFEVRRA